MKDARGCRERVESEERMFMGRDELEVEDLLDEYRER